MSRISADDLTFYKEDGKIMSGGFNVSSILMKNGFIPSNSNHQKGGSGTIISSLFDNLAVPAGLLYQEQKQRGGDGDKEPIYYDEILENGEKKEGVLDEDIYEQLLKMIEVNENPPLKKVERNTRKMRKDNKKVSNKKTKKTLFN